MTVLTSLFKYSAICFQLSSRVSSWAMGSSRRSTSLPLDSISCYFLPIDRNVSTELQNKHGLNFQLRTCSLV
jgi:hypothetical protein